ncbi:COX15/CtaA family protein, partial [Halorussus sp. GCM10023401]
MLAATAIGVYLLVVVGATTALTEAAAACPTWPACNGRWVVPLDEPKLAIAWGHRVVALGVGLLLAATFAVGWRDADRRVKAALAVALALYPGQILLGAFAATTVGAALVSGVHLVVGMAIFSGVVLALAWTLEPETFDEPDGVADPEAVPDVGDAAASPT